MSLRTEKLKSKRRPMPSMAKNPMKTLGRLLKFIFRRYWLLFVIVFVCIALSSFASVQASSMISDVTSAIEKQLVNKLNGSAVDYSEIFRIILTMVAIFVSICLRRCRASPFATSTRTPSAKR